MPWASAPALNARPIARGDRIDVAFVHRAWKSCTGEHCHACTFFAKVAVTSTVTNSPPRLRWLEVMGKRESPPVCWLLTHAAGHRSRSARKPIPPSRRSRHSHQRPTPCAPDLVPRPSRDLALALAHARARAALPCLAQRCSGPNAAFAARVQPPLGAAAATALARRDAPAEAALTGARRVARDFSLQVPAALPADKVQAVRGSPDPDSAA